MTQRRLSAGSPETLGVMPERDGVNVAVFSHHADAIEFCLFDATGERELERIRLPERTGDIFHGHIADVGAGARYGLRAHGPYDPAAGHRFNARKLLVDPHALLLDRPFRLHGSMFGYRRGDPLGDVSFDEADSANFVPKAIVTSPSGGQSPRQRIPWAETILYELHVRGFSQRNEKVPEALRGTFAGLAHPASLAHLTKLGITTLEIMPPAAWVDERHLADLGLSNYWGYNSIAFGAPDPRLAPGGWAEVRAAVEALHGAGIEVIVDVVLNHSGEGDEFGPTLSLRGLDNASYYRLRPGDGRHYVNDAGCGNILALDRPPVLRLAMDSLRAWAQQAGIDGFRFDLATTLARRAEGFDPAAPFLGAIAQDQQLRGLKLIAEPWDIGPGGYQVGAFPSTWGEWNDKFRDGVRRFWRGDGGLVGELATRLAGSADVMAAKCGPSRGVNFVVAHDGFTLADLVAYTHKHNEANGENNRDGTDSNYSWNHGVEGATADDVVQNARRRDQRNLLATLLLSRGTPMLAMGAELGHSQHGNNNAYAQDNATSWLDWSKADNDLADFTQRLIALRREHPALREDAFLSGHPTGQSFLPDVEWRNGRGLPMQEQDWHDPASATLMAIFCTPVPPASPDRVAVILHRGQDGIDVPLPEPRDGHGWTILLDSAAKVQLTEEWAGIEGWAALAARSVVVLAETARAAGARAPRSVEPETLARLSAAAGIAARWFDVGGKPYEVSAATQRAVLAGMGLRAETQMQALESLTRLSSVSERRDISAALVRREGEVVEIRLGESSRGRSPPWLRIEREDGTSEHLRLHEHNSHAETYSALDGREGRARLATLPPLPIGRHRVWRDDRPDLVCHVTIAPARCYLPDDLSAGHRRFGVAAHLYTLRRAGDQGIGDFTTLRRFAELAAEQGAAMVGLNPLHALFGGARERASPYHPSDRRFLDPIYIDVAALDDLPAQGVSALSETVLANLRAPTSVDYPAVWALKSAHLQQRFRAFAGLSPQHPLARDFAAFVERGGASLERFACFEAISEAHGLDFRARWPSALRDPADPQVAAFATAQAERLRYHMFLQWLSDRQLGAAARAGHLALGFYRDLAVGTASDGAEAWAESGNLVGGVSVGSPPDPFSESGQLWHLPPLNPLRLAETNYRPFVEPIAANMRHAGALRIDHAMGLARLFFVPDGARPSEGTYVAYPLEDLIGQLALESQRHRCLVVGEDLGTVPEGFRERLAQANVLSYRVLWFERDAMGFKKPDAYPAKAVACVSTHDLPTLAGWWSGADIAERQRLGLIDGERVPAELTARAAEKLELANTLVDSGVLAGLPALDAPLSPDFAAAAHAYLAQAPSVLVMAQADDLAGEASAVNLPGTDTERPNWRRKLHVDIEGLFIADMARPVMAGLAGGRGEAAS
jgi:glycogen operon protein